MTLIEPNKKKNIYFDVENTLDVPFITGIQRVTREFAKAVLEIPSGFDCRYIPILFDHKKEKWRHLTQKELQQLKSNRARSIKLAARIFQRLSRLISKPSDLYIDRIEANAIFLDIDSSWHSKLKRSDLLPKLKAEQVKIAKLHYDLIPLLMPELSRPKTIKIFTDHFFSHLEYSNLFICISQKTLDDVIDICANKKKEYPRLELIKLGSNLPVKRNKSCKFKRSTTIDTQKLGHYVLCVGTLEPRKNQEMLIEAFSKVAQSADINLVIVGKIGWLSDESITQIHSHPQFGTRLFHLDNINDSELEKLYKHAWLNVVPSLYEGFGLPVTEGLLRGCPTICSSAGSLPEVCGPHALLFSPYSKDELINLLLDLAQNDQAYKKLKQSAESFKATQWTDTARQIDRHLSTL